MKVVHIQTGLPTSGNAAFKLHKALLDTGIQSAMLALTSNMPSKPNLTVVSDPFKSFRIVANRCMESFVLRDKLKDAYAFSYPVLGYNLAKLGLLQEADIIIIHWSLGGFLNLAGYRKIAELGKPVLFFLHDMWTLTGGCHHSFDCKKYVEHCSYCPMFAGPHLKDPSFRQFEEKKSLYSQCNNLYFAAPSRWLFDCMEKSALIRSKPKFHLPNIINDDVFKPFDKAAAKQILNVDPQKIVIAFGAKSGAAGKFKGWAHMKEALCILKERNRDTDYLALVFGSDYDEAIAREIPYETKFTGYLQEDHALGVVYNAADVFVAPSLADNFPSTVLESQSCNTPVVAFNVGGLPDLIDHQKNGYLADYLDPKDLAKGIDFCVRNKISGYLKKNLDPKKVIEKYVSVFHEILGKSKNHS